MSAYVPSPLFRPEVAEARKQRLYGEIVLAQPIRAHLLTELLAAIEVAHDAQTVAAFGERLPLQPGMTLKANLILDRRSFLDWLLQPLNAVMRRNQ